MNLPMCNTVATNGIGTGGGIVRRHVAAAGACRMGKARGGSSSARRRAMRQRHRT